ncbi:MAG: flagellar basal body-associated FliL family protein [Lachnospiraceae bacterium]|nr:flagellar basal body-associated FliL family protein [Lachnospiraceae bacterium]
MKKNLISIIILALMVVNIILSAITMFSVISTNNKTAALVAKITESVDLELASAAGTTGDSPAPTMATTEIYDIADSMTIPLAIGEDGTQHYYVVNIGLSMNTQSEGYTTYGATIANYESPIKDAIIKVIGSYTLDEIQADQEGCKQRVLEEIQKMFDSDFVYQISFSNALFQ